MGRACELASSGLSTDVLRGMNMAFAWATQGLSGACREATTALCQLHAFT